MLDECKSRNAKPVLILMIDGRFEGDRIYENLKSFCLREGIVSQFMNDATQQRLRSQLPMICATLTAHIMAKLGTPVWIPTPLFDRIPANHLSLLCIGIT